MDVLRDAISTSDIPTKHMAIRCGVSVSTIRGITSGRTSWPRPTTFFSLCSLLDL